MKASVFIMDTIVIMAMALGQHKCIDKRAMVQQSCAPACTGGGKK
ncbi:hypothetical protein RM533_04190 [Croceicoccus sp. F390]|uniref:Uncharacterized protein n=1 Tax=Croceicoccus esteveae TaxID=3075597 RepID=A0ABU2ZFK8_9SPHN|nr:hypothetical protein [Croceicoccus sp. F390]MDT0575381.1 hypothetical protein [Croceicoccus sp. F390]